ncbi:MAG: hypothetical protein WCG90_08370 [Chitinophagia bacterium]
MLDLLEKVMSHNQHRYNGALIMFNRGKWWWNNKPYDKIQDAKIAVDESIKAIKNSIWKP